MMKTLTLLAVITLFGCNICIPEETNRKQGNIITREGAKVCSESPQGKICGRPCN